MTEKMNKVLAALESDRAEDMKVIRDFEAEIAKGIARLSEPETRWGLSEAIYKAVGNVAKAEQAVEINNHIKAAAEKHMEDEVAFTELLKGYDAFLRDEIYKSAAYGGDANAIATIQRAARNEAKHNALKYTISWLYGILGA